MHVVFFVLDGLALAGRRPLGDGAGDEEDELLGRVSLEVAEVADVGGVGEDHCLRRPRRGGIAGAGAFQDEERGDLHRSDAAEPERETLGILSFFSSLFFVDLSSFSEKREGKESKQEDTAWRLLLIEVGRTELDTSFPGFR